MLGLHATDDRLTLRGVRSHIRKQVMPHVQPLTATASSGRTSGPRVPTAVHVNAIRDRLVGMKEAEFRALKAAWSGRSVQTWDPFAPVGDARAAIPVQTQRPCKWSACRPPPSAG